MTGKHICLIHIKYSYNTSNFYEMNLTPNKNPEPFNPKHKPIKPHEVKKS